MSKTKPAAISVRPTILALPYLSAITPPKGAMIKKTTVVVPSTKPNIFAEPFGRANIPKANAIGHIPLPKFEMKRSTNESFTYLNSKIKFRFI